MKMRERRLGDSCQPSTSNTGQKTSICPKFVAFHHGTVGTTVRRPTFAFLQLGQLLPAFASSATRRFGCTTKSFVVPLVLGRKASSKAHRRDRQFMERHGGSLRAPSSTLHFHGGDACRYSLPAGCSNSAYAERRRRGGTAESLDQAIR